MADFDETRRLREVERLRNWIGKYKIVFEGPSPSQRWPAQYKGIFRSIRDIDRIRFDDYAPNEKRALLTVAQIKDRVANINEVAYACRHDRVNEQTWRLKTEHWILWRFDAEVACGVCKKRLWISEIQTFPEDPERAEELRSRRAQRVMCTCSQSEKAMVDRYERGQTRVFADRAEDFVLHQDSVKLLGCGVKERKPDRVFGLANTTIFDRYVSVDDNIRHSPFVDGKVLYPFLIIEAKSEKGSPGFESIESQTAFPIRSLLQLQERLARRTGIALNPLLWFLANQGDEWRVYAAVVDNSYFRVFDLWHGTILSQDCALQLLLIIDTICDWARDTYRLDVLRCLSGGKLDLRALTPGWSSSQSQNGHGAEFAEPSSRARKGTSRPQVDTPTESTPSGVSAQHEPTQTVDTAMLDADGAYDDGARTPQDDLDKDAMMPPNHLGNDSNSVYQNSTIMPPSNLVNNHRLLQYDRRHQNSPIWTKFATIQHSDLVQFTFQYFTIPEDLDALRELLKTENRVDDLAASARETLSLFESRYAIQTDIKAIVRVAEMWTGDSNFSLIGTETPLDKAVQARVVFYTYFDVRSWQTIRLVECFTCSQKAWNLLLQVSRYENPPTRHPWTSDHRAELRTYIGPLRYLRGEGAVTAALMNLELQLCEPELYDASNVDLIWKESERYLVEDLFHRKGCFEAGAGMLHRYARSITVQREISSNASGAPWLDSMLEASGMKADHGAILLRKPPTWPESCPFVCLAVFSRDIRFEDERSLGNILEKVSKAKDVYVIKDGENRPTSWGEVDRRAVHLWLKIMEGSTPADTAWSMLS